jgi:hypothetical protein
MYVMAYDLQRDGQHGGCAPCLSLETVNPGRRLSVMYNVPIVREHAQFKGDLHQDYPPMDK